MHSNFDSSTSNWHQYLIQDVNCCGGLQSDYSFQAGSSAGTTVRYQDDCNAITLVVKYNKNC